jgi:hypothetical protein
MDFACLLIERCTADGDPGRLAKGYDGTASEWVGRRANSQCRQAQQVLAQIVPQAFAVMPEKGGKRDEQIVECTDEELTRTLAYACLILLRLNWSKACSSNP